MRIREIHVEDFPPIRCFEATELSDVVVIAGRNGVGKSRLVMALIASFRGQQPNTRLILESTSPAERSVWGKQTLDTAIQSDYALLTRTLQQARRRTTWTSSVVQFESDRSVQQLSQFGFSWDIADPWEESVGWDMGFGFLRERFQDTMHSILRKMYSRRNKIAKRAEELMSEGMTEMPLDFENPMDPFKRAFAQLLAPKELLDPDLRTQQITYSVDGRTFPLQSLSSGEREVVNIVFDFLLRQPEHSIVFFDEPELHLHPELSYRLLQTLQSVGQNNQFIFCTHSPDIITASLDYSVIFLGPPKADGGNQAIPVQSTDETNEALRCLGQSVGIVALGKRIVLVEGTKASLDKQTYGAILDGRHPDLVLVPSEGKDLVTNFSTLYEKVLNQSIWGVEFFMLCDLDTGFMVNSSSPNPRFQRLKRYHLENYFLDEQVIAMVFADLETADSWLRDPAQIRAMLEQEARSLISYTTALNVSAEVRLRSGNVSVMPRDCHGKSVDELCALVASTATSEVGRLQSSLEPANIETLVRTTFASVEGSFTNGEWKSRIPGKALLGKFISRAQFDVGRFKRAYIRAALTAPSAPFADIYQIFHGFASL